MPMNPTTKQALRDLALAMFDEAKPALKATARKKIRNGAKAFEALDLAQTVINGADVALQHGKNLIADVFGTAEKK